MKKLQDILYGVSIESIVGSTAIPIKDIEFDSRKIKKENLFIAQKGVVLDGHDFIFNAIEQGAVAVVCEKLPKKCATGIVYVIVASASEALGHIAANFYDNPSKNLKLIGVTGTNGKTTVASLLFELFTSIGYPCGLISTVKISYQNSEWDNSHTTPDAISLNKHLSKMTISGISHCFMELSSHGIAQRRANGLHFNGGVFTNLTHDHLDYHGDFKSYRDTKKLFFDQLPKTAFALTNIDDKNGTFMFQNCIASKHTYAVKQYADFKAQILEYEFSGMLLKIQGEEVWTNLVGEFNIQNLLAVYAVAVILGESSLEILKKMSTLKPIRGRFETFQTQENITVVIDYAHTPDALANVLQTINKIRTRNESLITVVGCGGNRDREKRPMMGKKAAALSDKVIFTSDNPRDEEPTSIISEIVRGVNAEDFKKVLKVTLREEAIAVAGDLVNPGDIVLIAGKGHETYQEIEGKKIPFNDLEIAKKYF
ncbi:MAG: UDP-N-acetylmuramoyl-L-alanyl-D-glutamate--2,6-diaminopimelate ligase [Flavobacteriaceae bacterium]|nr:UDP-N-acetylmuramoyl-L-alanyl-D-glutamate--2,6-diaminopimelate ligase [Flavobacteriaceae bacterium]MDG2062882.1 UDP-N-acetylmuramoyl-L-alanyl-D-glutamate--2,6-diaminopimelate ligase [Flavobacteriaceae bacterium]